MNVVRFRGMARRGTAGVCLAIACAATLGACGPTIFEDKSALTIIGDPPPLPPPPPPVVEKPKRVEVRDNAIVINEKIQFDVNKATIREESHSLLKEIGDTIKENKHIKKISIEGHASAEGDDRKNMKLSDARAKSVMKYLIDNEGIPKEMLTAKGFGETKPIADNETEDGREKNRRVEFIITEQDITQRKVEVDPETGKETVLEEKPKAN